jgi:hypothetical protein
MGAGQQGCTEETLIIQGARARMQHFAMYVAAARSALTFALIRPKERKRRSYAHACTQSVFSTDNASVLSSALVTSKASDRLGAMYRVPTVLITLFVSHYICDQ